MKVMEAWGFSYEMIAYIWVKRIEDQKEIEAVNAGKWTWETCELCFLATRGNVKRIHDEIEQPFMSSIRPDRKIPFEFKKRTVELLGNLPALELFSDTPFTYKYDKIRVKWDIALA